MDRAKLQEAVQRNPKFTPSRKTSLYSNFERLRDANPDGYEANTIAWTEVLVTALSSGAFVDRTCLEASADLVSGFSDADNGTPMALASVISDMVTQIQALPLNDYLRGFAVLQDSPSLVQSTLRLLWSTTYQVSSYSLWIPYVTASRIASALSSLVWSPGVGPVAGIDRRVATKSGQLVQQKYVVFSALETQTKRIIDQLAASAADVDIGGRGAQVSSVAELYKQFPELSELDVQCCLMYATSKQKLLFDSKRDIVKLDSSGSIDEVDVAIVGMRKHRGEIEQRMHQLETSMSQYGDQIKAEIKARKATENSSAEAAVSKNSGMTEVVRNLLYKRDRARQSYRRLSDLYTQLDVMLDKIGAAHDNKQAVSTMRTALAALSELNADVDVNSVDEVMDNLRDMVDSTNEVTASLGSLSLDANDETELEEELEAMHKEVVAEKRKASKQKKEEEDIERELKKLEAKAKPVFSSRTDKYNDEQTTESVEADAEAEASLVEA